MFNYYHKIDHESTEPKTLTVNVPYGYKVDLKEETFEEAVEFFVNKSDDFYLSVEFDEELNAIDPKIYTNDRDLDRKFDKQSDAVKNAVIDKFVNDERDVEMLKRSEAEAEKKAAYDAHIAEQKAKYESWKQEATDMGITFSELCDMKHAENVEAADDWDWDY